MNTRLRSALAALIASGVCLSTWAAVTASLDRTQVAVGERLRLVINNTGNGDQQPDTSALRQDFEILGTQRGSSLQIVNGHMSSQTQFTVLMSPKHAGTIRIAPITWGGEQSAALELTVAANANPANPGVNANANSSSNAAESQITMSGTLDQKQPYVQSAVVLSLRLNVGVQMAQASLDLQGNGDVLVRQIGQDQQHTESRNGRVYQVIERKYLLIPQRSGAISLKGPVLQAQVQDDAASSGNDADIDTFFGSVFGQTMGRFARRMRPVTLQANAIEMNVQARPASADASNWLPAQKLTLEETWRPEPQQGQLHVGEPLTRHLRLNALGVTAGQLPDLANMMAVPDGIKKYPDQAKTDEGLQGETLRASRDQDIALVASAPGHYVVPALRLVWWDTLNHTQHAIELPECSLDVLPATGAIAGSAGATPNAAGTAAPSNNTIARADGDTSNTAGNGGGISNALLQATRVAQATTPWLWISGGLAVLWLGTLLLWWRARRAGLQRVPGVAANSNNAAEPAAPPRSTGAALAALQRACRANDPRIARQHVLEWAAAAWPQSPPRGLNRLAERLGDPRYTVPLQQLDRACYTAGAAWNGTALAQAFDQAPKPGPTAKSNSTIPDLYD
nr:BatD family protein [Rhodoferax sp.]